jgi:outer membrane lipoprotein carrier protein
MLRPRFHTDESTMSMSRILIRRVAALALLVTPVAFAGGIQSLEQFYEQVSSLEARFEQTQVNEDGDVMQQASGIFLLDRPNRFRWEYRKPYEQVIASDGDTFRFYDVDLEQVTIRDVDQSLQATPAVLLAGGASLEDEFSLSAGREDEEIDWVTLTPRSDQSDFRAIRIGLDGQRPVRMELDDQLGQTTRIRFFDIRTNKALGGERFSLAIPDGVEIVDGRRAAEN